MRPSIVSMIALSCVLGLAACSSPSAIPSFYSYHKDEFHSPSGRQAHDIGYEYSEDDNAKSMVLWNHIADDLVVQLEDQYGVVPQDIYLVPHKYSSVFLASYDTALRSALKRKGYRIATHPEGVPDLYFEAVVLKDYKTHEDLGRYNSGDKEEMQNRYEDRRWRKPEEYKMVGFRLTLGLDTGHTAVLKASYAMPTYGYEGDSLYSPYLMRDPTPAPVMEPQG